MIRIRNKAHCMGCGACANRCPKQCITMTADEEGFWYPQLDEQSCIRCGACVNACPIQVPTDSKSRDPQAFAAISKDDSQRLQSSSGGVFSLLAVYVLEQGGVVFGAAFTEDFKGVHHIAIESQKELWRLRSSKYLQSSIGQTYSRVKEFLRQGRMVLFTGTACQIGGLYSYLGKDHDLLYTQSVICHGVASPLVWKKYADFRENTAGQKLKALSFRIKDPSWKHYSLGMDFENGTQYKVRASEDPYLQCYIKNYTLRPSCFDCRFKSNADPSDLTLGDFWGIQDVLPAMHDDQGTSLVLVRSEKGRQLLNRIEPNLNLLETDYSKAIAGNPAALRSVKKPIKRDKFMADLRKEKVENLLTHYGRETVVSKTMSRLKWYRAKLMRKLRK